VGAKNRALAEGAPLLAILGTDDDTAAGWLRAGQALQRMLLVACRDGLQASFLNQPMQVAALRPRMGELAGGGFPQVLVRLGLPCHALRATPRRALDEVLERPWPRAARPAAARGQSAARTAPGTMNALSS
jgi:hypothetical protein